ncbi:MAG TPA: alpha/beta hydrolase-fold protein, partial [Cyclobacteriaceae bacterium]|nr:alpha/beta hydrolase-fold protein [Cyclobacteriaceae bacterium]
MLPITQLAAQSHVALTSPAGTDFWIYTPASYNSNTPAPLLVSLHGLAQIGNDINLLTIPQPNQPIDATPAYLIDKGRWPASRPFIVVSPQLKPDGTGVEQDYTAAFIDEVVEHVKTLRTIDTNRIYFTGLSLGGQGSMIYAMAYPAKVTALVTMANRTNEIIQDACNLVNKPLWMFHGTDDAVFYSNSVDMLNAITSCSPTPAITPHLTTVHAGRHDIWNAVYDLTAGFDIYNWLLQFSLADTSNKPPFVHAGTNKKFLIQDEKLYLHGDAFDIDGTLASIQWTKLTGPAVTLENTNSLILTIRDLLPGTFSFRLTATDSMGLQRSDDINITIANSAGSEHTVTGLTLYNGLTNTPISPLTDGLVINKNLLGVQEVNVLATTNKPGAVSSHVVFRVNEHHFIRAVSVFNPAVTFIFPPQGGTNKEWQILPGAYTFCGTAITGSTTIFTENFSKCVRFQVFDQPIKQFYAQTGQDLSLLSSWNERPDGSGAAPESFTGHFQVFNVETTAQQNGDLTIGGVESYLWIKTGGELTLNNNFTGVVNIDGNGVVNINTSQPVIFGSVSPASTVRFSANATAIPLASYGHVILEGSGKTFAEGTTEIAGNLNIETGVVANGALSGTSTITLSGNLNVAGVLNPTRKFNLNLKESLSHTLTVNGLSAFHQLTVKTGAQVLLNTPAPATLQLGTVTGGGLVIENNGELDVKNNTLTLTGQSVISCNQTGRVGFSKGNLVYNSQSTALSTFRTKPGADSIQALLINGVTGGQLIAENLVYVLDSIKVAQAVLHSTNITLVSTANKTARIAAFEGTGNLLGTVGFQRYIRSGRMYRYLAFPVGGVSVDSLQEYMPVTGNFIGASHGAGLASATPSLFRYENNDWVPYPTTDSTAQFLSGTGYSVFMRNENSPITVQAFGTIHRGDFVFNLQPGTESDTVGWNLLGNPYAAPIHWNNTWNATGLGTSVYVRDNEQENNPFLVWDGEAGDAEFSGKIAQGQAFWIKSLAANPLLTVTELARVPHGNFYRTQNTKPPVLTIDFTGNALSDKVYIKYKTPASTGFNTATDAYKLKNAFHNLSILTRDSVLVAIKSMPDS